MPFLITLMGVLHAHCSKAAVFIANIKETALMQSVSIDCNCRLEEKHFNCSPTERENIQNIDTTKCFSAN